MFQLLTKMFHTIQIQNQRRLLQNTASPLPVQLVPKSNKDPHLQHVVRTQRHSGGDCCANIDCVATAICQSFSFSPLDWMEKKLSVYPALQGWKCLIGHVCKLNVHMWGTYFSEMFRLLQDSQMVCYSLFLGSFSFGFGPCNFGGPMTCDWDCAFWYWALFHSRIPRCSLDCIVPWTVSMHLVQDTSMQPQNRTRLPPCFTASSVFFSLKVLFYLSENIELMWLARKLQFLTPLLKGHSPKSIVACRYAF